MGGMVSPSSCFFLSLLLALWWLRLCILTKVVFLRGSVASLVVVVITGVSPEEDDVDDDEDPNLRPSFSPFLMKNGTGNGTATKGRCTAREDGEPGGNAPPPLEVE